MLDDLDLGVLEVSYAQARAVLRVSLPLASPLLVATTWRRPIRLLLSCRIVALSSITWRLSSCSCPPISIVVLLWWATSISIQILLTMRLFLLTATHFLSLIFDSRS